MDYIAQYSYVIVRALVVIIALAMLGMVFYVACQGNENQAPDDGHTLPGATQNRNVNGGIRHPYKDINSY